MIADLIRCRTCTEEKDITEFWRSSRGGWQTECKSCMRIRTRNWFRAHKREAVARARKGYLKMKNADPVKALLIGVKCRAKSRDIEFALTPQDVVVPALCPVLGIPLVWNRGARSGSKPADNQPSIDRIENDRGYTPDNIVVISWRANRLKSDASLDELFRIASFYREITDERSPACAQGHGHPSEGSLRRKPILHLPALFADEEKEKPPVPICEVGGNARGMVLPPLRLEGGDR